MSVHRYTIRYLYLFIACGISTRDQKIYMSKHIEHTVHTVTYCEPVGNLNRKTLDLTLRQSQVLVLTAQKTQNYGLCKFSDLLADTGVAHATLADHLAALQRDGYIQTPSDKDGNQRPPRNLSAPDPIQITEEGKKVAMGIVSSLNATYNELPSTIFEKLKKEYEPKWIQRNLFGTKNTSFAKAFEELVERNPLEPVLTTISMYNELDTQLSIIRRRDLNEYVTLSRAKLNLEIRNGRLASIAIPIAIRNRTKLSSMKKMLCDSWSWAGTVSSVSTKRYWAEATSLGLVQVVGNSVQSLKHNTIDTITWLARKTHFTFINTIPTAPKCSLVLFRESFRLPTEADLLDPNKSDKHLEWLQFIYDNMGDKSDYIDAVTEALSIIKDRTNLVQDYEGSIVPTTLIRLISEEPELKTVFDKMLKDKHTVTAQLLRAISAKPSISLAELKADISKEGRHSKEDIEETIYELASKNLIHMANSRSASKESTKLFSFIHVPYLYSKRTNDAKEANALLRGMNPYLLQQVKELFSSEEDGEAVVDTLRGLTMKKEIYFDDLGREYDKTFERKMFRFALDLEPFAQIKPDQSGFALNEDKAGLNDIIINSLIYSTIARNDALDVYASAISGLAERDTSWSIEVIDEAKDLTDELIGRNQKRLSPDIM
jgi:DNA-binding MarR family transcriptional regulator/hemoglobin-like flavoprotein